MIVERWNDDRLDQLAASVAELSESSIRNDRQISSLGRTLEAIANQMAVDREERNLVLQIISRQQDQTERQQNQLGHQQNQLDQQQSEIRGLRLETKRILDYLLNQQDPNDPNDLNDESED